MIMIDSKLWICPLVTIGLSTFLFWSIAEVYSAFLAEIKAPSPRVFSLNLERQTFIKVQFLYEDKPAEKETNMLVMLHKECES